MASQRKQAAKASAHPDASWPRDRVLGLTHITLAVFAVALAVGLSFSQVSRRLGGQVAAESVDWEREGAGTLTTE